MKLTRSRFTMLASASALAMATGALLAAEGDGAKKDDAAKPAPTKADTRVAQNKAAQSPQASPPGTPTTAPESKDLVNLLPNPSFEEADEKNESPKNWQEVDNLIFFWTTDPAAPERKKVMKIDTDVNQRQAYDWWFAHYEKKEPLVKAPKKQPTVEPKWDTIAGLDGGFYWSGYIPIKPGRAYKVYVDAKGPGSKVFIRGYDKMEPLFFADENKAVMEEFRIQRGDPLKDEKGRPIRYFNRYSYTTWFPVGGSNEWKTYTHDMPRHPTGRELTENVRYIRIMLYPYWPPGEYWYDNIRVYEVDPAPDSGKRKHDAADVDEGKVIK